MRCAKVILQYGQRVMTLMNSTSMLLWNLLFGAIGLGFFTYGSRQKVLIPWLTGVALMLFSYFTPNIWALVLVGTALTLLPYFVRL